MPVDLRVVEPDQFGNLLQHFTGSKAHNVALRETAVRRGLHVSEYGVLDDATGDDPPLRDGGGGLRAARPALDPARAARGPRRARLPQRRRRPGAHRPGRPARRPAPAHGRLRRARRRSSRWRRGARDRGLEYLAITDHSATHGFGNHVDADGLRRADRGACARSTSASRGSRSSSAPRRTSSPTAALDYDDDLLAELDWVIASVHTSFGLGRDKMTERVIIAMRAPVGRRDRPPHRAQDRDAAALRDRRRARDRRRRADADDARDQLGPRPPRPQRRPRQGGRGGGRADPHRLRRALRRRTSA